MPLKDVKNVSRLSARREGEDLVRRSVSPVEAEPKLGVRERGKEMPGRLMRPVNLYGFLIAGHYGSDKTRRLRQGDDRISAAM